MRPLGTIRSMTVSAPSVRSNPAGAPLVRLARTRDGALWDRLVAAHPGSTAFHDWAWLDLQASLLHVVVERLVVIRGSTAIGVFPVARRSRRAVDSPYLPFPFVGPLVPADALGATLTAFRRWQRSSGLLLARFEFGPADSGPATAAALTDAGFDAVEDASVEVVTAYESPALLQAEFSSLRRRDIRRAVRDGAEVRAAAPGEFAQVIGAVLDETYGGRGRRSPYPADAGARFEAWAAGRADVRTWVVTVGGEIAGAQAMLGGHPTAVAWVGGCLQRFRDANPNAVLSAAMLEAAVADGHTALDFSGWVDEKVGAYKLAFGGTRVPYLRVESSLVPGVVRRGLQRAKALRR